MRGSVQLGDAASLTPSLLMRAATLHAELARACAVSRRLIERGHHRRLSSSYPRLRAISGGSDAGLIAVVITGAALCLDCITKKTGVPAPEADALLVKIAATLKLVSLPGRCDSCLDQRTTFRLDRTVDGVAGAPMAPTRLPTDAASTVWRYLGDHRGQMFCTQCLTRALGVAGRLDRAVIAAEGRGAVRRYSGCTTCGKERLVTGLP
jgi:hypothetical protein